MHVISHTRSILTSFTPLRIWHDPLSPTKRITTLSKTHSASACISQSHCSAVFSTTTATHKGKLSPHPTMQPKNLITPPHIFELLNYAFFRTRKLRGLMEAVNLLTRLVCRDKRHACVRACSCVLGSIVCARQYCVAVNAKKKLFYIGFKSDCETQQYNCFIYYTIMYKNTYGPPHAAVYNMLYITEKLLNKMTLHTV